jgi:hypothetical protein
MSFFAARASAHDSCELLLQWQRLAKLLKLNVHTLGHSARGQPLLFLETGHTGSAVYLSAGVHGDEPAGPWALLSWAWNHQDLLRERPFLIAPCLNPDGLQLNTRVDEKGRDLNRLFHTQRIPWLKQWHSWMCGKSLQLCICLHEDYDARGCYVYATGSKRRLIKELMAQVHEVLPVDPRKQIEGRPAMDGIIYMKQPTVDIQGPEALVLMQRYHCAVTLNFETPSEFDLDQRMEAQLCFIQASLCSLL